MKVFGTFMILFSAFMVYQVSRHSSPLEPKEFKAALKKSPEALLIDLRSAKDFTAGHLQGAMNMDCDLLSYKWRVAELDTTLPVFLYCKDGQQSEKAAIFFHSSGFVSITEMEGGFQMWESEQLPSTPAEVVLPDDELTWMEFSRYLDLEHDVIVDYYIPWNTNCQKMEPLIDELAIKYDKKVKIIRINTDTYKRLAVEQGITVLPTYQFYENGNLTLTLEGITERAVIEKQLKENEYAALKEKKFPGIIHVPTSKK